MQYCEIWEKWFDKVSKRFDINFQETEPFTEIAMEAESLNNSENVEDNQQITDEEVTAKDLNSCSTSNGIKIKSVKNQNVEAIELVETPTKSRYIF